LQHEHQRLEQASVIADLQAALLDQQRSIGLLKAQWRFQKSQLQDRVGQLVIKRMRILEGLEEAVRAPVYGQVTDLRIQAGAGVAQGELLFTLVDPNSRPTVELALPSTATGRVLVGMRTKLSFTAYPVTDHGFGDGTIREIAEVANFTDGEAFYRAVVEIDRFPRDAIALPAGMNVSAYLELASNPLWHWFLKPLEATWVQL
jgi:membrane fusion protein